MRVIPEILLTEFSEQQGVEPLFIVGISWEGTDEILYSTKEYDTPIYGYVQEFINYKNSVHVSGVSQVSSISIIFNDMFGHFREKLDTLDPFHVDTVVTLYLTTYDQVSSMITLFTGVIQDPIMWDEKQKTLIIDIAVSVSENVIGYTPSISNVNTSDFNYDFLRQHLQSKNWPNVFGSIRRYEAPALYDLTNIEVIEVYNKNDSVIELNTTGSFTLNTPTTVIVVGDDKGPFHLIVQGEFKSNDTFEISNPSDDISKYWYKDIQFTPIDESIEQLGDDINDIAWPGGSEIDESTGLLKIDINVGSFTDNQGSFQSVGPDDNNITDAYLQFMTLEIFYYDISAGVKYVKVVRCVRQEENICTIAGLSSFPDNAEDFRIGTAGKYEGRINRINVGAQVYPLSMTAHYIIDTKAGTTVDRVEIETDDGLIEIPSSFYTVSSTKLWGSVDDLGIPGHPSVTYIVMTIEALLRFFENLRDKTVSDGVLVSASNSLNTAVLSLGQINLQYGSGHNTVIGTGGSTNFVLLEEEDVIDILGEIAWSAGFVIRENSTPAIEIIDLIDPAAPVMAFTDANIQQGSVRYGFKSTEDIRTIIKIDYILNDLSKSVKTIIRKNNVDRYDDRTLEADIYIYSLKSTIETAADFWVARLSKLPRRVSFNAFLSAVGLEVYDRVSVSFSDPTFYDASDGSPFNQTHSPSTSIWQSEGFVQEINPNIQEGLIEVIVLLDDDIETGNPTQDIRGVE